MANYETCTFRMKVGEGIRVEVHVTSTKKLPGNNLGPLPHPQNVERTGKVITAIGRAVNRIRKTYNLETPPEENA